MGASELDVGAFGKNDGDGLLIHAGTSCEWKWND